MKISISVANKDLNASERNSHQKEHSYKWLTPAWRKKIPRQCFNTLVAEPLLPLSFSA